MEEVYVIPAANLLASPQLIELTPKLWDICHQGQFMPREQAEQSPAFRQIIPYCIVRHAGQVLLMRRTKKGGEARLHDRYTLGVGGHINPVDAKNDPEYIIFNAMKRELYEEISLGDYEARPQGLIVLEDSPVSRVHAGIVFWVESEQAPQIREKEKLEGRLVNLDAVQEVYAGLEDWSKLALDAMKAQV
jgi:predicted NUDIX family phosphoesterase